MDFSRLETERLVLRKANENDLTSIFNNVWSDASLAEYMFWEKSSSLDEAKKRLERTIKFQKENRFSYFVCLKDNDEAIGFVFLDQPVAAVYQECNICISKKYQNKGYGSEVLGVLLETAFNKVIADIVLYGFIEGNEISKKLMNHYPFKYFSTQKVVREKDNKELILNKYSLSRDEYREFMKNKN